MEEKEEEPKEETISEIEKAIKVNEETKKLVEAMRIENDRYEKRKAIELVGGKTDAGEQPPEKKEETPQEYRKRIEEGIRNRQ